MYKFFKAFFDFVFSLLGIIVLFPLFLIVGLLIAIDSRGPIVFKQERVGKDQKIFKMYKFRTMKTIDVPFDVKHPVIKNNNENLTRVGKWVRRFKLDEFLQLLNVLKGDMSLIGPRPLKVEYLEHYEPWELQKFDVKPGMSGLAQVRGNGHLSSKERSYYDVEYTKIRSLKLDAEILFKTVIVMLGGEEKFIRHVSEKNMRRVVINHMREENSNGKNGKGGKGGKRGKKSKNRISYEQYRGENMKLCKTK
ncbi:MAG: sugar transferase [Clostridia bacterium]|nr:sugar transferase [Clostridia bacterium]